MLTDELTRKLAHLARLQLDDAEVKRFTKELDDILQFFSKLQKVDTTGVTPIAQITDLQDVMRIDNAQPSGIEQELLRCTPNKIVNNQIAVQSTF